MNSSHTTRRDLGAAYIAPIGMNIIIYNIIFIMVFIIVLCGCSFGGLKNCAADGGSKLPYTIAANSCRICGNAWNGATCVPKNT